MSDDSESEGFNFGYVERTEVDGLIKVSDVVGVEVGKVPLPHELDDPEEAANPEPETLWIKRGDEWRKEDDELGLFDIEVVNIFEVDQEDIDGTWYEVEVKHTPVITEEDSDRTESPLVHKQSAKSFAQQTVNYDSKGNAGLPPEKREE